MRTKRNVAMLAIMILGTLPVLAVGLLWSTPPTTALPADQPVAVPAAPAACSGETDPAMPGTDKLDPPCYVSFCAAPAVRCVFNKRVGCGCKYVSQVDPSCTQAESPPPDFCNCT